ncbi:MAG: hypothetical protein ACI87A_003842, partial [Planctomycetota bacterium]
MEAPLLFAAALTEVFDRLDWEALGKHYCFEGGEDFFDEPAREKLFEAQIAFASETVEALQKVESTGTAHGLPGSLNSSLYVGAALSEIGPMLAEKILLQREVHAFSLDNPETREINRCLALAGEQLGLELPTIQTADLLEATLPEINHLWLVSVFNDPEAFPALHDKLYQREGTDLAMNAGDLAENEARASHLCRTVFKPLSRPALLTTSDEELP